MNSLDRDGNGVIDYTEFITAAIEKSTMLNKQNLISAFKMIDQDNSGLITVDELKAVFDNHGDKKDQKLWEDIMREVDSNKDNNISFEEFTDAMTGVLKKQFLN
jgi:calcium-dependent protein kinase